MARVCANVQMKKRVKILAVIAVAAFLSALMLFAMRVVPAVRAGGRTLAFTEFFTIRDGLAKSRDLKRENVSDVVLEDGVILSFIEDALVRAELQEKGIGEAEVTAFLFGAVKREDIDKLNEATSKLYGWSIPEFENYVLLPQARRIMLVRELQKNNVNADKWIEDAKKSADVSIYLPRWKWEHGELKSRY